MQTRSKSKTVVVLPRVDIDFDEASRAWRRNKMYLGEGQFRYKTGLKESTKKPRLATTPPSTPFVESMDFLAKKNVHPRDKDIVFEEGPHLYFVKGKGGYTSVTTWNHSHFPHFDADKIIDGILAKNDPRSKYTGKSREDIKAEWDANRDGAAAAGTKMHYDIECYWNGATVANSSTEYSWFQRFVHDFPDLKPYRTEWCVYFEELKLSGSIDMVFENPDGTLQIYDWKRCREIAYESFGGQTALTPCIKHIPDSNFWHYALQLNVYKMILEKKYDKKVTDLFLVCLHPDNPYQTYDRIEVPMLDHEMEDLISYRKSQVASKTKKD